jgi:SpoU rRNA methylase family enzyme
VNGTLLPAAIVTGNDKPPTLNTELFELAAVTVTLAPLAVKLPDAVPLVPTTTLPKARVVGLTVSCPTAVTPVPDNGIVSVGFDAFEVIVTFPLAAPAEGGVNETLKVALCPDVSVTGAAMPFTLKPDPLTPTCEIVTLWPPLFVTVSDSVCLFDTCTLPKLRLVGFDPSVPAVTPVPDNGIVSVGFDAFEVIVTFPLAAPAEGGVNDTLKVALCPDVSVTGVAIPLRLNPLPLTPTCDIVTLEPPLFVTVSERVCLFDTCTLPKLRLVGFDPSVPAVTPVPDNGIVSVGFDAFEVIVTFPLAAPAEGGVKETLKVALCPDVSVTGVAIPLRLNPLPLTPTCEIVTLWPPLFVTVSDSVCLFDTCTLPKLRLVGFDPSVPAVTPVPDNGIVNVEFDAFEVIVTFPLTAPAEGGVNDTLKVALCPDVSVTGAVIPLTLKPVPLTPTCEIVTLDPPELVTVSERVCLFDTCTLPKLRLVGLDPTTPGANPVPDSGIVNVGFDAFEVIATLPLAAPADVGLNETLKVALCPDVSVTGAAIPLRLNPVPLAPT